MPENPCEGGLDATVVGGSGGVQPFRPAAAPEVDCFYVYPTVSKATALNAPLAVDDSLVAVARAQAARFGEVCRVFAPVYRQITLSGIFTGHYTDTGPREIAERDVRLAWEDYLANDNDGRGVVLVGHSQGARTLTSLLRDVEADDAVRERLVSALLIGGDVTVPQGQDVGGSFAEVPACREGDQTGCVVAYSSFAGVPPTDALFGRTTDAGREVLCTDPDSSCQRRRPARPLLPTAALAIAGALSNVVPGLATGFAAYPGQLTAECRRDGGTSYLQVGLAPGARLTVPDSPLGPRWGCTTATSTSRSVTSCRSCARRPRPTRRPRVVLEEDAEQVLAELAAHDRVVDAGRAVDEVERAPRSPPRAAAP